MPDSQLQSYAPTEAETSNVFACLNTKKVSLSPKACFVEIDTLSNKCAPVNQQDDIIEFDEFVFGFYRFHSGETPHLCRPSPLLLASPDKPPLPSPAFNRETPGAEFDAVYDGYAAELNCTSRATLSITLRESLA